MTRPLRLLRRVVAVAVVLSVGYLVFTAGQVLVASRRDEARPAEAIVVLGAAQYDGDPHRSSGPASTTPPSCTGRGWRRSWS
jgi:hypothetical protein